MNSSVTGSSQSSSVSAMPPTQIPISYPPLGNPSPPVTSPGIPGGNMKLYEEDRKQEWEPEFQEIFSKTLLKLRLAEYFGGKYTQRYIQTYLEFMVLSGMINNLEYLEFKNLIIAGEKV